MIKTNELAASIRMLGDDLLSADFSFVFLVAAASSARSSKMIPADD